MKKFFVCLILLLIGHQAAAANITLDQYYQANCKDYSAEWEGWITDPTGLFGNGGPWPVKVTLYAKRDKVYGSTGEFTYAGKSGTFTRRNISARCENGKLVDIFWGNKDDCGSLSQKGLLVSKNVLVMQLNWESAMIGANFLLFLQRKGDIQPVLRGQALPEDHAPAEIKSCH